MKKILIVLVLALSFSCQQERKVGFVDNGELINGYQMKIDIEAKYEGINQSFTKRMDSLSQEFQQEVMQFQTKQQSMSQKELEETYQILGQKQQQLQQRYQAEQQELEKAFQTEIDTVISKVKDFVKQYGQDNSYTFILGSNEAGSVIYGEESSDLTKVVLEALNAKYTPEK
jgi:outer membrane protein